MGDASGTAPPLPLWRFAAARGHRPSINVRISPPEQSARLQRLTLQQVPFAALLAWPQGLSPSTDVEVSYKIADDLYLSTSSSVISTPANWSSIASINSTRSSESAPRSSAKCVSLVTNSMSTRSCLATSVRTSLIEKQSFNGVSC